MKIVCVQNSLAVAAGAEAPRIVLGADSALLRCGEPVFLPDDSLSYLSRIAPAFRIGRLGLNIPLQAAAEYIDAHTLFHLLVPATEDYAQALWGMSDRSFSPGAWCQGLLPASLAFEAESAALYGDEGVQSRSAVSIDLPPDFGARLLHRLSRHATFKTGDVVVAADIRADLPAVPDTRLQATLHTQTLLNIKIK